MTKDSLIKEVNEVLTWLESNKNSTIEEYNKKKEELQEKFKQVSQTEVPEVNSENVKKNEPNIDEID